MTDVVTRVNRIAAPCVEDGRVRREMTFGVAAAE